MVQPNLPPGSATAPPVIFDSPRDRHSLLGWTRPFHMPLTHAHIEIHKVGSVLLSLGATGLLYASSHDSPEGLNFPISHVSHQKVAHYKDSAVAGKSHYEPKTYTDVEPVAGAAAQKFSLQTQVIMPDAPTFNLNDSPQDRRILSKKSLAQYIATLRAKVKGGDTLDSCEVTGTASDETRQNNAADIGLRNPLNQPLAAQYGQVVKPQFVSMLTATDIRLQPAVIHEGRAHEVIVSKATITAIDAASQAGGFKTKLELIKQWKAHPEKISPVTRRLLDSTLARYRGALIQCFLTKPAGPTTYKITEKTGQVLVHDHSTTKHTLTGYTYVDHGHNRTLPIFLLPLPWFPRRRKSQATAQNIAPVSSTAHAVSNPPSHPVVSTVPATPATSTLVASAVPIPNAALPGTGRQPGRLRSTVIWTGQKWRNRNP